MKKIKHMTFEQIVRIKELFASGMNYYQISKELRIPPHVTKYHTERVILERATKMHIMPTPIRTVIEERIEEQECLTDKQKNKMLLDFIVTQLSVH